MAICSGGNSVTMYAPMEVKNDTNEQGLTILAEIGDFSALLTGDMGENGEKEGIKIMGQFVKKISNKQTALMIKNESTTYAATTPAEMVADEYTELIVNSLNPKTLLPDKMRFEMLRKKEPFLFDKLLDACWNGDVEFVNKHRKNESLIKKWLEKRYRPVQ